MTTIFPASPRVLIPIMGTNELFPVRRVYCVGRNYSAHALEMGHSEREAPFFFSKPADAVIANPKAIPYPAMTKELHHEVELVIAIGKDGFEINLENAWDHVYGYAIGVDLTKRDLQKIAKDKGRPWDLSKGFDQSAPISSIVTADDIGLITEASIELKVNNEIRQSGNIDQMIWSIPEIIVELSKHIELKAGDLIFTGTPSGVNELCVGDQVSVQLESSLEFDFFIE